MLDLVALLERFASSIDRDTFVVDVLDTVVDACGAARGLIVRIGPDGARHVVQARGEGRALDEREREEVSRTILARAYATPEVVTWTPLEEAQISESIMELDIVAAMAVSLRVPDRDLPPLGVLYLDYRDPLRMPTEQDARQLGAISSLLSASLAQSTALAHAEDEARGVRARTGGARIELADLLRFPALEEVSVDARAAVDSRAPVLIEGESGTGKTALAEALAHARSGPVVRAVFAGSDDAHDVALSLFGRLEGTVAGAPGRKGLVEHAEGGTLVLDEVSHLPARAQELLLDFTEEHTFRPLGDDAPAPQRADVRIVATSSTDLQTAVDEGRFRKDLFFRLNGIALRLPPLAERREDIPSLAATLLRRIDPERPPQLAPALRNVLTSELVPWPGNIRELESVLRRCWDRARLDGDGTLLGLHHLRARDLHLDALPDLDARPDRDGVPAEDDRRLDVQWAEHVEAREQLELQERALLQQALLTHDGSVSATARTLGMSRTSLASRLNTLGIKKR